MSKTTIYDIAKEAGVSPSTVSRILRGGSGHVYPETTQKRVIEIARRLGYRANAAARLLSQNTSTMIGIAVHFTEHPYLNRFLVAIHQELLKRGYDPVFLDAQHLSDESSSEPFPPPHMLAGFITPALDLQKGWPGYYAEIRSHVPIVALQPISAEAQEWVDVVQVDFEEAYLQTCEYLLQLGHRNIAYLGGFVNLAPSESHKMQGWMAAAKKLGISTEYRIPWGDDKKDHPHTSSGNDSYLYQNRSRQALAKAQAQLLAFPERITALVCSSDEVAIGFQSYLQAQGWDLPDDLSVVGYDGISMGEYVYPPLTTIAPDYTRMAEAAVERLLQTITSGTQSSHTEWKQSVAPYLIKRDSTAKIRD